LCALPRKVPASSLFVFNGFGGVFCHTLWIQLPAGNGKGVRESDKKNHTENEKSKFVHTPKAYSTSPYISTRLPLRRALFLYELLYEPVAKRQKDSKRQEAEDKNAKGAQKPAAERSEHRERERDEERNEKEAATLRDLFCEIDKHRDRDDTDRREKHVDKIPAEIEIPETREVYELKDNVIVEAEH